MKRKTPTGLVAICLAAVCWAATVYAHCEIPCGIYNDELRIALIKEDVQTIEKSTNQIIELSKANPVNYNQLVRWINNKEEHANKIQDVVTQYFLTQRVKPADPKDEVAYAKYVKQLSLLHEMLVQAMKAKQTTDMEAVERLKTLTGEFYEVYFGHPEGEHAQEQHK
jgi:nickel superoxide dismutase